MHERNERNPKAYLNKLFDQIVPEVFIPLADTHKDTGEPDKAIHTLAQALKITPNNRLIKARLARFVQPRYRSEKTPQTWGVWEKWLGDDSYTAIRRIAPKWEPGITLTFATLVFVVALNYLRPGGLAYSEVFKAGGIAALSGQLLYASFHFFWGVYTVIEDRIVLVSPWDPNAPSPLRVFFSTFLGKSLLIFHLPYYLFLLSGIFLPDLLYDFFYTGSFTSIFRFSVPTGVIITILFVFTLAWAYSTHNRSSLHLKRKLDARVNARLREEIKQTKGRFRGGERLFKEILDSEDVPLVEDTEIILDYAYENTLAGALKLLDNKEETENFEIAVLTRPGTAEGANGLGISELNDLIGPANNDILIAEHNRIIREIIDDENNRQNRTARLSNDPFIILGHNYNSFIIAVRTNRVDSAHLNLTRIKDRVQDEVSALIMDPTRPEFEKAREIISTRPDAYMVHFGVSGAHSFRTESNGNGTDDVDIIVAAYAEAMAGMNMARVPMINNEPLIPAYHPQNMYRVLNDVYGTGGLAEQLEALGVMSKTGNGSAPSDYHVSEAVLSAVRKKPKEVALEVIKREKQSNSDKADDIYELVLSYYRHLRVLDFMTPWVTREEKRRVVDQAKELKDNLKQLEKLQAGVSGLGPDRFQDYPRPTPEEVGLQEIWNEGDDESLRHSLADNLSKDPRAPTLGSRARYFGPTSQQDSTYIAIDIERFGAMVFEDLETAAQDLWDKKSGERILPDEFKKAVLTMGENTLDRRTKFFIETQKAVQEQLENSEFHKPPRSNGSLRQKIRHPVAAISAARNRVPTTLETLTYAGGDEIFIRVPSHVLPLTRPKPDANRPQSLHDSVDINPVFERIFQLADKNGLRIRVAATSAVNKEFKNRSPVVRSALAHTLASQGHVIAKEAKAKAVKENGKEEVHSWAILDNDGRWWVGTHETQGKAHVQGHPENEHVVVPIDQESGAEPNETAPHHAIQKTATDVETPPSDKGDEPPVAPVPPPTEPSPFMGLDVKTDSIPPRDPRIESLLQNELVAFVNSYNRGDSADEQERLKQALFSRAEGIDPDLRGRLENTLAWLTRQPHLIERWVSNLQHDFFHPRGYYMSMKFVPISETNGRIQLKIGRRIGEETHWIKDRGGERTELKLQIVDRFDGRGIIGVADAGATDAIFHTPHAFSDAYLSPRVVQARFERTASELKEIRAKGGTNHLDKLIETTAQHIRGASEPRDIQNLLKVLTKFVGQKLSYRNWEAHLDHPSLPRLMAFAAFDSSKIHETQHAIAFRANKINLASDEVLREGPAHAAMIGIDLAPQDRLGWFLTNPGQNFPIYWIEKFTFYAQLITRQQGMLARTIFNQSNSSDWKFRTNPEALEIIINTLTGLGSIEDKEIRSAEMDIYNDYTGWEYPVNQDAFMEPQDSLHETLIRRTWGSMESIETMARHFKPEPEVVTASPEALIPWLGSFLYWLTSFRYTRWLSPFVPAVGGLIETLGFLVAFNYGVQLSVPVPINLVLLTFAVAFVFGFRLHPKVFDGNSRKPRNATPADKVALFSLAILFSLPFVIHFSGFFPAFTLQYAFWASSALHIGKNVMNQNADIVNSVLDGTEKKLFIESLDGVLNDVEIRKRTIIPIGSFMDQKISAKILSSIRKARGRNPNHEFIVVSENQIPHLFKPRRGQVLLRQDLTPSLNLGAIEHLLGNPDSTRLVNWMGVPIDASEVRDKRILDRILYILVARVGNQLKAMAVQGLERVNQLMRKERNVRQSA